jgi:thiopeptide-type bacteriocin biosynthesis protein
VRAIAKPFDRFTGPLYEPIPYVLIRTPSLSLDDYVHLKDLTRVMMDPQEADLADPRRIKVREAISVASPSFLQSLDKRWHRRSSDLTTKLVRYLIRMSSRPVPFGLFAGVGLVAIGKRTDLRIGRSPANRCVRPDMDWLWRFVQDLEGRIEIRRELQLCANRNLLVRAGRAMITEARDLPPDMAGAAGVSIRATDAVLAALQATQKYRPYRVVLSELTTTLQASVEQVEALVTSLCQHDFIRTDLRPPFTTEDPARYVLQRLAVISAGQEAAATLENILECSKSQATLAGTERENLQHVAPTTSEERPSASTQHGVPAIQVDAATPLEGGQISKAVADEAARAAELLLRMTAYPAGLSHIAAFRQHFIQRYGHDRQVPLTELLDPNFGLGAQWTAEITELNEPRSGSGEDERSRILLDLACRALRDRTPVLELTPDQLAALETWRPTLETAPPSLDVSVLVAASCAEDIDAGKFQIVVGPGGGTSGAGRFAGRFAGLLGQQGNDAAQMIARGEEATAPNALWAELICIPRQSRLSNVTIRPAVRRYEIALDTTPGVDEAHTIRADDLVVGVRAGRFFIRWLLRDRDIRICSGHMLAPDHLPSLGRFLAEVSQDGFPWLHMFYWGPAELFPYLPRLQVGRVVLRPAQWRLRLGDLGDSQALRDNVAFHESLTRCRARLGIPRYVYLGLSSERLLLDLEDSQQAAELRLELERFDDLQGMVMQEVIPTIDQAWLQGPGGKYASEFIVSLVRRPERSQSADSLAPAETALASITTWRYSNLERLRPPGTEWLYLKIYCGRDFQDDVLSHRLQEFGEKAISTGLATDWFFVRYADPEDHLRVRFRGVPEPMGRELMPSLSAWASSLIADDLCLRFSFETYERELERYGGPEGMAISERIFAADSRAAVSLLHLLRDNVGKLDKMLLSALSTDDLLSALGTSEEVRLKVYRALAPGHEGGTEFRRHKTFLRQAWQDGNFAVLHEIEGMASVFQARRREVAPLGLRLTSLSHSGILTREIWEVYASFVHLHLNRLLGVKPKDEQPVCGMLRRLHQGLAATRMQISEDHKS